MSRLSYAMQFWSHGRAEALFLHHEGYLGAVGALIIGSELASAAAGVGRTPEHALPTVT